MIPRPYFTEIKDNFVITPALVVQIGRCECCDRVGGVMLSLSWLCFEVGLTFHFGTSHE